MDIFIWIILGLVIGWIAARMEKYGNATTRDLLMGVIGAIIGGLIVSYVGRYGFTTINLSGILVSVIGATVLIYIGRMFRRSG
jgi:uncharacterized membrane protein YeaQ/YmgE (transglycosylase-associated protein family)